jgi:uncharacterized membrane protein YgdD (TMEM256/DUF423 family)
MLIVSVMLRMGAIPRVTGNWVCGLLLAGILLFSGSLYALALSGVKTWGAVTPLGGTAFIAAWIALAVCLLLGKVTR